MRPEGKHTHFPVSPATRSVLKLQFSCALGTWGEGQSSHNISVPFSPSYTLKNTLGNSGHFHWKFQGWCSPLRSKLPGPTPVGTPTLRSRCRSVPSDRPAFALQHPLYSGNGWTAESGTHLQKPEAAHEVLVLPSA